MDYDLVIIGAGPAGLSAALTASYMKLKHVVLEANLSGGALIQSYPWKKVDSYLGYWDKTGQEISEIMTEHVKKEGSDIHEKEPVTNIEKEDKVFVVHTPKAEYKTKSIILSNGISGTPRKLGIPGEDCRRCHYSIKNPALYEGLKVLVVGGGDTAVEGAMALAKNGAQVYLAHRRDRFRCTEKNTDQLRKSKVNVLYNTELTEIKTDGGSIKSVIILDNKNNKKREEKFDDVFFFIGSVIDNSFLECLNIEKERNKIKVDDRLMTSVEGIFAAGDNTGKLLRIPEAIGEGHMAVYNIFKYLRNPYWSNK